MLDRARIESYDHDRAAAAFVAEAQVKQEPRDVGRSPRQKMSPHYQDFRVNPQWNMGEVAAGGFLYQQGLAGLPGLQQVGQEMQMLSMDPRSPNMQAASPLMQVPAQSPHLQSPSPHYQSPSPHMHVPSPHMQMLPSPHYQDAGGLQAQSPHYQSPSPHMHMLPTSPVDHTMINAGVMQQPMQQQQQQQQQLPQVDAAPPVSLDNIPSADISLTSLLGFLAPDDMDATPLNH